MLVAPTVILAFFALFLIGLGWLHGDTSSADAFNMADRRVPWIQVAFGAFTVVGAGELVGVTAYSYNVGIYAISLLLGFAAGALILAKFGERACSLSDSKRLHSLPDYVNLRFGRVASLLISIVSIVGLGALLLIQFAVGGIALSSLINVSVPICISVVALTVAAYVWLGGFKAILFTDLVQGTAMFLFLVVMIGWIVYTAPVSELIAAVERNATLNSSQGLAFSIVLFVSGMTAISGGADIWQRMLSSVSPGDMSRGMSTTSYLYIGFGVLLTVFGVHVVSVFPDINPNSAFVEFLVQVPISLLAAAVVGLFAALISTADAELLVLSVVVSSEANRWGANKSLDVGDTRWVALVLAGISAALGSVVYDKLADVFSILLFILMVAGPVAWVSLSRKGNKVGIIFGQLAAILVFAYLWIEGLIFSGLWSLLIPLPVLMNFMVEDEGSQVLATHEGRTS